LALAMRAHPEMVAGETGACTDLMRAMDGKVTVKGGADGVYIAIIPERRLGVALKIADGSLAASECAIASVLVNLGVLNPDHPLAKARRAPPIMNGAGLVTGQICPMPTLQ
jgi:L-asparaginase II